MGSMIESVEVVQSLEDVVKERYLVSETARILDVSRQTLMKWIDQGRFKGVEKEPGNTGVWLIPADEVERVRQERLDELNAERLEIEIKIKRVSSAMDYFD